VSQTIPFRSFNSKILRYVDFIAAIVAVCIVGRLAWQEDLSWFPAVVACVFAVFLTTWRWPYGILTLLIGASAMPAFSVDVFGWNARPEHFAVVFAAFAVALWVVVGKKRLSLTRLDYFILFFLAANFISSSLGSSDPASTLRWALQNCLAVVFYFLIRALVQDAPVLGRAVQLFLAIAVIESVYGVFCYLSHQAFGTSFGVSVGQYMGDVAAPFGTMFEPNLFGAYTASASVMFFSLYLFAGHRVRDLAGFFITAIASFFSFSRASLIALLVAGAYLFWKSHRQSEGNSSRNWLTAGLVAALILLLSLGPLGRIVSERFMNLFYQGLTEETTISRVIIMQEALQDVSGHLLIGRGTASFNLTFDWARYVPSWAGEKTWIGNAPLRILHDTGLLGLGSIIGFFVTAWVKIRHAVKVPSRKNGLLIALWAGVLIYAISFESTDGTILAFTWVQLGLLASAATLAPVLS
jgi:O-antigen ligase